MKFKIIQIDAEYNQRETVSGDLEQDQMFPLMKHLAKQKAFAMPNNAQVEVMSSREIQVVIGVYRMYTYRLIKLEDPSSGYYHQETQATTEAGSPRVDPEVHD